MADPNADPSVTIQTTPNVDVNVVQPELTEEQKRLIEEAEASRNRVRLPENATDPNLSPNERLENIIQARIEKENELKTLNQQIEADRKSAENPTIAAEFKGERNIAKINEEIKAAEKRLRDAVTSGQVSDTLVRLQEDVEKLKMEKLEVETQLAKVKRDLDNGKEKNALQKFGTGTKNFLKNWWRNVTPQGKNKIMWALGLGVGVAESVAFKLLLPPAGGWLKAGLNALIINTVNGFIGKEALQRGEKAGKWKSFTSGLAAGSVAYAVGSLVQSAAEGSLIADKPGMDIDDAQETVNNAQGNINDASQQMVELDNKNGIDWSNVDIDKVDITQLPPAIEALKDKTIQELIDSKQIIEANLPQDISRTATIGDLLNDRAFDAKQQLLGSIDLGADGTADLAGQDLRNILGDINRETTVAELLNTPSAKEELASVFGATKEQVDNNLLETVIKQKLGGNVDLNTISLSDLANNNSTRELYDNLIKNLDIDNDLIPDIGELSPEQLKEIATSQIDPTLTGDALTERLNAIDQFVDKRAVLEQRLADAASKVSEAQAVLDRNQDWANFLKERFTNPDLAVADQFAEQNGGSVIYPDVNYENYQVDTPIIPEDQLVGWDKLTYEQICQINPNNPFEIDPNTGKLLGDIMNNPGEWQKFVGSFDHYMDQYDWINRFKDWGVQLEGVPAIGGFLDAIRQADLNGNLSFQGFMGSIADYLRLTGLSAKDFWVDFKNWNPEWYQTVCNATGLDPAK